MASMCQRERGDSTGPSFDKIIIHLFLNERSFESGDEGAKQTWLAAALTREVTATRRCLTMFLSVLAAAPKGLPSFCSLGLNARYINIHYAHQKDTSIQK